MTHKYRVLRPLPQTRSLPQSPLVSTHQVQDYAEMLDLIARLVAHLPQQPSSGQRKRLRIIATELNRRAGEE